MNYVAQPTSSIAIRYNDYKKFGCPGCRSGNKEGYAIINTGQCQMFTCSKCSVSYIVCADAMEMSSIGVDGKCPCIYDHPQKSWFQIKSMIRALKDGNYELYREKQKNLCLGCNDYIWDVICDNVVMIDWHDVQEKEKIIKALNGVLNELSKSKSK